MKKLIFIISVLFSIASNGQGINILMSQNGCCNTGSIYDSYITDGVDYRPVDVLSKPSYLGSVVEPTFGATIYRVTGDVGVSVPNVTGQTWRNIFNSGYPTRPAWNNDQSVLYLNRHLTEGGSFGEDLFVDGNTYEVIKIANLPSGNEARWHPTDSNKWLVLRDTEVVEWNYTLETETQIASFAGYTSVSMGDTGNFSDDSHMFAASATRTSDSKSVVFAYNTNTDTKHPDIDATGWTIDYVTISPLGTYIYVVADFGSGTDRQRVYNATTGSLVTSFTELGQPSHADLTVDNQGNEVAVGRADSAPYLGKLIKRRLSDGVITELTPLGGYGGVTSCRNINQRKYAVTNTAKSVSWLPYYDEIIVASLDGDVVYRIAYIRKEYTSSENQTNPVFSPYGDKILFTSDWDANTTPVQCYVIEIN